MRAAVGVDVPQVAVRVEDQRFFGRDDELQRRRAVHHQRITPACGRRHLELGVRRELGLKPRHRGLVPRNAGVHEKERRRSRHAEAVDAGLEAVGEPDAAPVRQLRELLDARIGRRLLRARAQRERDAQCCAASHGVVPGASADRLAVGRHGLEQQSAFAAFAQRRDGHGQRIAGLHGRGAPTQVIEIGRRGHLEVPFLVLPLVVLHDELDVAVRIRPLEFAHRARQRQRLRLVEHDGRVMRERGVGAEHGGRRVGARDARDAYPAGGRQYWRRP